MINRTDNTRKSPTASTSIIRTDLQCLPTAWRYCLGVWAIFRVGLTALGWLVFQLGWVQPGYSTDLYFGVNPITTGWKGPLLSVWIRWDAIHYIRVASHGYNSTDLSAFFPLYPLFGKIAGLLTGDIVLGLIVVSSLCLLFAAVLLYTIAEEMFGAQIAERAVIGLMIYPFSIFLFAPFTESLSLLLILLTYQAMRRRRWTFAILAGLATGLTRGTVVPLAALLMYQVWQIRHTLNLRSAISGLLASGSPLAGIAIFLAWRTIIGFPPYQMVQTEYWERHFAWPLESLLLIPERIQAGIFPPVGYVHLALLAGLLVATLWMIRRLPPELVIFQMLSLAFILTTTRIHEPFASLGRFSLILFPTYLAYGAWADTPRKRLWSFAFLMTWMLLISGQYFMWGWVG